MEVPGRSSTTRRPPMTGCEARRLLGEALLRPPRRRPTAGGRRRADRAAVSRSPSTSSPSSSAAIRRSRSSCGLRRSRRTWAPTAPRAIASKRPASPSATSVASGARARARATRRRTPASRSGSCAKRFLLADALLVRAVLLRGLCGDARPMLGRDGHDLLAVLGRQPSPQIPGGQRYAHRADLAGEDAGNHRSHCGKS